MLIFLEDGCTAQLIMKSFDSLVWIDLQIFGCKCGQHEKDRIPMDAVSSGTTGCVESNFLRLHRSEKLRVRLGLAEAFKYDLHLLDRR